MKKAYHSLISVCHPDRVAHEGKEAVEAAHLKFLEIQVYCRVVHVKALSELQIKMLTAYMKTTMLPRNLAAGQISAEVFSISQSEVFVVSKFILCTRCYHCLKYSAN